MTQQPTSKKPNPPPLHPPAIFIRRVDAVTFELIELRNGLETILLSEAYPFVKKRAQLIIQQMAEGVYK